MQVGSYATRAYDNDLDNIILGNERNNFLYGDKGNDTIYGEDGNDEIEDYSGNNLLDGGNGNDTIMAYGTNDTINGGAGDDSIFAYNKYSEIKGGNGNDIIAIRSNISEIDGGEGWDTVDIRDTVDKNDIAVYSYQKNGNTFLDIDYGVTVGKYKTTLSNVEVVKIAGNTVSTVVLNNIAQDVAAYITENGLNYTSVEEVKNDANLMNLINSAWS